MITICLTIKNRSRVQVNEGKQWKVLTPYPTALRSILQAVSNIDGCLLSVADWESNDLDVDAYTRHMTVDKLKFAFTSIKGERYFSRGHGLNVAASHAQPGDVLFFTDTDMLLTSDVLAEALVTVRDNKAYFPICWNYTDMNHTAGRWRDAGYGITAVSQAVFDKAGRWPELYRWGGEDRVFSAKVGAIVPIVRKQTPGLFHMWHPDTSQWKNQYAMQ